MQKKRITLIGIIIIIIATAVTSFGMIGGNSLKSHLKKATKFFNDGKYEEVIFEFDKALAIDDEIFYIYLAKANAEIAVGRVDDALESTIKMIELLKVNDEITNKTMLKAHNILLDMYNTSEYNEKEDLLVWFYEVAYGNVKYADYISWIEEYLPEEYSTSMEWIRNDHEEYVAQRYTKAYGNILLNYQKAMAANYEYDYVNGEEFNDKYPGINSEVAANMADELQYSIIDINDDNIPELIIGEIGYIIYDIYSLKDGKPERLFDVYSMGNRNRYTFYRDGVIRCESSGGVSIGSDEFFRLNKITEDTSFPMVTSVEKVLWEDNDGMKYYKLGENDTRIEISEEDYDDTIDKYTEILYTDIDWSYIQYFSLED